MNLIPLLSVLLLTSFSNPETECSLSVHCTGLSGEAGSVVLAIYHQEEGFPDRPLNFTSVKVAAGQTSATIKLSGLEHGAYAATLLHDTDGDERMDSNLIGIPKEGFAFSNNAKPSILGAPSFSTCSFLMHGDATIELEMIYF